MAIFSRGPKQTDLDKDAVTAPAEAVDEVAEAIEEEAPAPAPTSDLPHVGISTTSFGGFGAAAAPSAPEPTGEAPAPTETIPGLPDNLVLRGSLAMLGTEPEGHEILGVARQLLQGNVYLRVKGNAQELMAAGAELPLAVATRDEGQFLMLYSCGQTLAEAVSADGDTETSAMGQAGAGVLQYVLHGEFAGIIIDHASAPASVILPRALIERIFSEIDPKLALKTLVCGPRTDETAGEVAQALTDAPLWIAVNRASEEDDWGVAESRTDDGKRILPIFSHPLEVIALGRNDRPTPFTPAQLASALRGDEGIDGIVVDPAGPWIRLDRAQLGPLLALPEPQPEHRIEDESDAEDVETTDAAAAHDEAADQAADGVADEAAPADGESDEDAGADEDADAASEDTAR